MDRITHLNLNVVTFAGYTDICLPQFTKQEQGMSSLLAQGQTKRILPATMLDCFLNISGQAVKPVCRTGSVNTLMRTLMVIVGDPMAEALTGIGKRSEYSIREKLFPYRAPESLDLAECHRVMRGAADVLHALTAEHFLEFCFTPPGDELPTVIRKNLPGSTPLADGALDNFQNRIGCLLAEQAMAHDIAGVVINNPDQVDPVQPFELKGKNIDLPQRIRHLPLKPSRLRAASFWRWRIITQACIIDYPADRLGTDRKAFFPAETVTDTAYTSCWIFLPIQFDPALQLSSYLLGSR
jgi:hypothetical protein